MIRLQGYEMTKMRHKVKFISYSESKNGNIRVNLALKKGERPIYYHWLNEIEKEKFKKSEYYNNKDYKGE